MSHWNYRILAKKVGNEVQYSIYEVHYENDEPIACTENYIYPNSFSGEGEPINSLKWQLDAMKTACSKPILDYDNFPNIYHKYYRKKKLQSIEIKYISKK